MKKIIAITAFISLLTSGMAMAAELTATGGVTTHDGYSLYGGISATDSAAATTRTLIGKTSKGVKAGVNYTGTGYALDTKHGSGPTAYGTAHDATAIYKSEIGVSIDLPAPSAAGFSSFATWTAM